MPDYKVGDPDPTPSETDDSCYVWTDDDEWYCTWRKDDHPDVHVAGAGDRILAVWPVTELSQVTRGPIVIPPDYFELKVTDDVQSRN